MKAASVRTIWSRVLWAGVMAPLAGIVIVFLIVTTFALAMAVRTQGEPDPAHVMQFGRQVVPWLLPALVAALTAVLTQRLARQVRGFSAECGMLIGYIAGAVLIVLGLCTGGRLDMTSAITFMLVACAGWASALTGSQRAYRRA